MMSWFQIQPETFGVGQLSPNLSIILSVYTMNCQKFKIRVLLGWVPCGSFMYASYIILETDVMSM